MVVDDIMTPDPLVVEASTPVREVMDRLFESDVRHLPVVDDHELVGIVSDRDLREFTAPALAGVEGGAELLARLAAPISKVMSGDVMSVAPEADLGDVIDLMIDQKVGAVPVVSEGRLVGIVSYIDVLRAARDTLA